jgi:succinoglycan biosynthesis protein ExoA
MSDLVADVAVLIPARDEADSIERCLQRVLEQDLDLDRLEVIVVDGGSTDGTGDIARNVLSDSALARWVVHRNDAASTPSNLNAGLALVRAPIVCRVDARSLVPRDYVRRCAQVLDERPEVAVAGGAQLAVSRSTSARDLGIARALNNKFGMGLSRYRRGGRSGPADTVYLGSFRTEELRAVAGWDERLLTNQDFDLNRRLGRDRVVWFEDGLPVGYVPRRTLTELWQQYRRFGVWKAQYWRSTGDRPRPRQLFLLCAPPVAVGVWALAVGRSRRWQRLAVAVSPLAGAVVVDAIGSDDRAPSVRALAVSTAASGVIGLAWWSGALGGIFSRHSGGT